MGQKQEDIIHQCRQRVSEIDREIFALLKKREQLSCQIGRAKRDLSIPDRDFNREKEVFDQAKAMARELDLPADFVVAVQKLIIEASLSRQEQDRIKHSFDKAQKSVLVVGGAGRLGNWLCRFFADCGHQISVVDVVHPGFSCQYATKLDKSADNHDIIAVATPIRVSNDILNQIDALKLARPTIFDVSSVKAPVHASLLKLKNHGSKVSSLHPMFGPAVNLLYGKHVIRTSVGVKEADELVSDIFSATSLQVVDMSIDEHDATIAVLLTLSHLVSIVFVKALEKSSFAVDYLETFSSPTFSQLLSVARKVMSENPHLYFEIQALNPHSKAAHDRLRSSLADVSNAITQFDEEKFVTIMTDGEHYLSGK